MISKPNSSKHGLNTPRFVAHSSSRFHSSASPIDTMRVTCQGCRCQTPQIVPSSKGGHGLSQGTPNLGRLSFWCPQKQQFAKVNLVFKTNHTQLEQILQELRQVFFGFNITWSLSDPLQWLSLHDPPVGVKIQGVPRVPVRALGNHRYEYRAIGSIYLS